MNNAVTLIYKHSMSVMTFLLFWKVQAKLYNSIDSEQPSVGLISVEFFSCFTIKFI